MTRGDYKLVTHPELHPAVDFITRSSVGPFIDTGIDLQIRPQPGASISRERVYLSVATIAQLAELAGVVSGNAISPEREKQLIAQGKLEALREGLGERLDDVAGALGRWLADAGNVGRHAGGSSGL